MMLYCRPHETAQLKHESKVDFLDVGRETYVTLDQPV